MGRDVAFGLVVGERHRQVAREQQHLGVAVDRAFEQVAGLGLSPPGDTAVSGEPDQQRMAPRVEQRLRDLGWEHRELLVTGLAGGGVEPVQRERLIGPVLVGVRLAGGDQLAGQMRTAEGVPGAGVGVIDRQRVDDHGAAVVGAVRRTPSPRRFTIPMRTKKWITIDTHGSRRL